ncbi:adhesin [Caenimonas sedimenti]|uniref:Adhesin n=2 Tax=Caenimonas sedimenti TaxID=2596921 RepID=A0A562ZJS3_9BURK|nr:adhesin [Caenimonas sedimenti]
MLPHSDRAVVEPSKVRDYLLSPSHPIGRFKAMVFAALGYTPDQWETLQRDLLTLGQTNPAVPGQMSRYGQKYEVSGTLVGPSGRSGKFVSVWLIATGDDVPRLVTVFPG